MLLANEESSRIIALTRQLARAAGKDELEEALALCRKHQPAGYQDRMRARRARYEGRQRGLVSAALQRRFPSTYQRMPIAPLNWMRLVASQDCGVYAEPPERYLEVGEQRIDDETDPQAMAFHELVEAAELDAVMVEAERAAFAAGTVFLRTSWQRTSADDPGVPRVDIYWPDTVGVVCHPSSPSSFAMATLLIAQVSGPTGPGSDTRWYEVWSRASEDDDAGNVLRWGPWTRHLLSTDGDSALAAGDPRAVWPGAVLPWACIQTGQPSASVYVDTDHDLDDVVDGLNVSRSNETYTLELQGHTQLVYAGTHLETNEIVVGPDAIAKIGPNDTLQPIALSPNLAEMRAARKQSLNELAATRGNSPDAYATEVGNVLSGVSRRIANLPHDRKLASMRHMFRVVEEKQVLPMLIDLSNTFAPANVPEITATPKMNPKNPPDAEDPESKTRRIQTALSEGLITKARAGVELGFYASEDDAVKAGLSNMLPGAAVAQGQSPLQAMFGAAAAGATTPPTMQRETTATAPALPDAAAAILARGRTTT